MYSFLIVDFSDIDLPLLSQANCLNFILFPQFPYQHLQVPSVAALRLLNEIKDYKKISGMKRYEIYQLD
jgi:hypothetical protein